MTDTGTGENNMSLYSKGLGGAWEGVGVGERHNYNILCFSATLINIEQVNVNYSRTSTARTLMGC